MNSDRDYVYIVLMIKYPALKSFLRKCYETNNDKDLLDFLFNIELTDGEIINN